MPRALIPGECNRISLAIDEHLPETDRPAFIYAVHTCRQWRELSAANDSLAASKSGAEAIDKMFSALRIGLIGWQGMANPETGDPIAFDPNELDRLLTTSEACELLLKVIAAGRASVADRKNSESRP
jgi:hypothetical protein